MKNLLDKIKNFYLSFESKVSKRAMIITSAALLVGLIIAASSAAANAKAASQYDAMVDAINNAFSSPSEDEANSTDKIVTDTNTESEDESTPVTEAPAPVALSDDQVIAIDNICEFYIDFSNITKIVYPPSPASFYSYYEAGDAKLYVDLCVAYKNLTTNAIGADEVVSAKLTYDDKYEYAGFSCIEEDNRGDFTYSNITSINPLSTEYVHYLFEVPEVVGQGSESIVLNIRISGNDYTYTMR